MVAPPALLTGALRHRESLVEIARMLIASRFGREPAGVLGLETIEPVRLGPFRPDPAEVRRLIEITDGVAGEFETGSGALWLPPTASVLWLTPVLGRALRRARLKLPVARMLHAGNEVRFDRVPSTAEPLTLEARVASVDANERRTIVLVRTVHRDESGSQLFTVDTTLFFPGAAPREAGSKQKKTEKKDTVRVPFGAREIHRFRVRLADSRAYAAVSGDFNPVHISHLAARLSGFRGAFAHGYAIKARIAHRLIHTALGGEPTRLERLAVRFRRPVYLETETGIYLAEERDDPAGGRRAELYVGPGPGESAQVSGEAHWSA